MPAGLDVAVVGAGRSKSSLIAQAQATSTSAQAPEPDVGEIIAKSLTAYGGKAALGQLLDSSSFFGKKSEPGGTPQPYRHLHKGTRWRTDVEADASGAVADAGTASPSARTETSAFDGTAGWSANGGNVLDMPGDRLSFLNDEEERQPWCFLLAGSEL